MGLYLINSTELILSQLKYFSLIIGKKEYLIPSSDTSTYNLSMIKNIMIKRIIAIPAIADVDG